MVYKICNQDIPLGNGVSFSSCVAACERRLFLRVGTVGVNAEDSESLFDGAASISEEKTLPIKSRHWHIQVRHIGRTVKQPLKALRKTLFQVGNRYIPHGSYGR